ncbi:MAG: tRNA-(ms[2]io[6]A)-hydroxylase [Catalinimonas sp.]
MLGLKLPTDPRWADVASKQLADILVDHAYCEQKAASAGISMIVQYPELEKLVDVMTDLVAEEWGHFERVMAELRKRDLPFGRPRRDEYAVALRQLIRRGNREWQLMDNLLVNALIEARSCERFKLLSEQLADAGLRKFYYELMVSEAGHYVTFVDLANEYCARDAVRARLQELLAAEAGIIEGLQVRGDRMH